jgi:hypothetical protein
MRFRKTLWATLLVPVLAIAPALAQSAAKSAATANKAVAAASASAATPAAASAASSAKMPAAAAASAASSAKAPVSTGPAASAAGASGRAAAAAGPGGIDGATYAVRLRDLEQRIDELKEQIRRSHTRLSLLTDTVLAGGVSGSRADVQFQNEMSNAFMLVRALVVLDGAVQYNKSDDSGALSEQTQIPIFTGAIPPGDHTLQVLLQYQGNGYGVFSYLKGYHFDVRSSHSFTVVEGKTVNLQVIAYEKGGVTVPLEQRPAVRYVEKVTSGTAQPAQAAAPAPQAAPAKAPAAASTGFSIGAGGK